MIGSNARTTVDPTVTAPTESQAVAEAAPVASLMVFSTALASPPASSPTSPLIYQNRKMLLTSGCGNLPAIPQEDEETELAPFAKESNGMTVPQDSIATSDDMLDSLLIASTSVSNPISLTCEPEDMDMTYTSITPSLAGGSSLDTSLSASASSLLQLSCEAQTVSMKKRKNKIPFRSVVAPSNGADKVHQGIVQLDVFSPFLSNPKKLVPSHWLARKSHQSTSRTSHSFSSSAEGGALRFSTRVKTTTPYAPPPVKPPMVRSFSTPNYTTVTTTPTKVKPTSSAPKRPLAGSGSLLVIEKDNENDPTMRLVKTTVNMEKYKNTKGAPSVCWKKGGVLHIPSNSPGYEQITHEERGICSTLRILPEQYLHIKETILAQVERRGPFKKRDAKSWFRIDVNKTAIIYDWFRALGWIPSEEEWEKKNKKPLSTN